MGRMCGFKWRVNRCQVELNRQYEPGSSTVIVAAFLMVLTVMTGLILQVGWVASAQERAQDIADLAAISGAQTLLESGDEGRACAAAKEVSAEAEITCEVAGERVSVHVMIDSKFGWIVDAVDATAAAEPAW